MEEDLKSANNTTGVSQTGNAGSAGKLTIFRNKKILIALVLIILLLVLSIVLFLLVNKKASEKETAEKLNNTIDQNVRLSKFYGREQTPVDDPVVLDARLQIQEYAEKKGISVSDAEVEKRKTELIEMSGQDAINKTLESYGWTMEDWTEVVRSKLLNEKIIANIKPSRSGEVLSVRWDVYSPELNQEVADLRKGPATEFLTKIKAGIEAGSVKDLYTIHQSFDITTEPIFDGLENNYALQYSGWDEKTSTYLPFLTVPGNAPYETIMTTSPPEVTDVVCTLGGCQIYNITSGTNGDPEGENILKLIQENNIQF